MTIGVVEETILGDVDGDGSTKTSPGNAILETRCRVGLWVSFEGWHLGQLHCVADTALLTEHSAT